jgi:CBS domain containing-hemolysin-like protein
MAHTMAEQDAPGRSEADSGSEQRNLPVPLPVPEAERDGGNWIMRMLRAIFHWKAGSMRADLREALEDGAGGGAEFSPAESALLKNILTLRERRVADVMIPRADIVSVQQNISLGELMKVFEGAGHSRLVVYDDTLDDPVGMVHIRDLVAYMAKDAAQGAAKPARRRRPLPAGLDLKAVNLSIPLLAAKLIRTILFVPPSMPAIDLLARMQATRIHLALVVDEYGGTDGIVSIEDLVELIVGDIEDEHDYAPPDIVRQADGSFIADARASLEDVVALIGAGFDVGDAAKEVDTLGGYLVARVGRLPVRGELVSGPGTFEFEVLDADPRRVKRIRILRGKSRRNERDAKGLRPRPVSAPMAAPAPGEAGPAAPDSQPGEGPQRS